MIITVEKSDDNLWLAQMVGYPDAYAHGRTAEEALKKAAGVCEYVRRMLAEASEDTLTEGGRRRRKEFQEAMGLMPPRVWQAEADK